MRSFTAPWALALALALVATACHDRNTASDASHTVRARPDVVIPPELLAQVRARRGAPDRMSLRDYCVYLTSRACDHCYRTRVADAGPFPSSGACLLTLSQACPEGVDAGMIATPPEFRARCSAAINAQDCEALAHGQPPAECAPMPVEDNTAPH